jgi:hypothetical protein
VEGVEVLHQVRVGALVAFVHEVVHLHVLGAAGAHLEERENGRISWEGDRASCVHLTGQAPIHRYGGGGGELD